MANWIIVIDDDVTTLKLAGHLLSKAGYRVTALQSGQTALDYVRKNGIPDLFLLDINMPDMDGFRTHELLKKEMAPGQEVPVVFLTAEYRHDQEVRGLESGAMDYIRKPFDPDVLIAKAQALLRRAYDYAAAAPVLEHREAVLNTGDNSLVYRGRKIDLTKNEYRILLTLMQNRGRVVSREKLMDALWQTDAFVDENTLTVNVGRLRKKLDAAGLKDFITTKFGVGYGVGCGE